MGRVLMDELDEFEPGCVSTIAGGYAVFIYISPQCPTHLRFSFRRGKLESNDVDIVFTHPDASKVKGLCKRFVRRLHDRGESALRVPPPHCIH